MQKGGNEDLRKERKERKNGNKEEKIKTYVREEEAVEQDGWMKEEWE